MDRLHLSPDAHAGMGADGERNLPPRESESTHVTAGTAQQGPAQGPSNLTACPEWPRVLLAEDNQELQRVLARQLTLMGLEVVGVTNGRAAVDLALAAHQAGNPFALVLMDLEMPIVDGYQATRQLRESGFDGPILALSAHSSDDNREESMKLGCNDCLCKPFEWQSLARLISRYIPGFPVTRSHPPELAE